MNAVKVRLSSENECNGYQTKDFILHSLHDDSETSVKLIFCPSWPHLCGQLSGVTDLPSTVQTIYNQRNTNGPIAVIDRYGGTEAATFCAVLTLVKQLEFETHVDIYEYTKMSHVRRPGIWRSQNDYFFLYQVFNAIYSTEVNCPYEESSFQTFHPQPQSILRLNGAAICGNGHATLPHPGAQIIRIPAVVDGTQSLLRQSNSTNEVFQQRY